MCSTKVICLLMLGIFALTLGTGAGLIPFLLKFFNKIESKIQSTLNDSLSKDTFSFDVRNGLRLFQNEPLADILSVQNEANRTSAQNLTLIAEQNSILDQMNEKVKLLVDSNIESFFNLRMSLNQDKSIEISYSVRTKPMSKLEALLLKFKIDQAVKSSQTFKDMKLNNGVLVPNDDLIVSDPVNGELKIERVESSPSSPVSKRTGPPSSLEPSVRKDFRDQLISQALNCDRRLNNPRLLALEKKLEEQKKKKLVETASLLPIIKRKRFFDLVRSRDDEDLTSRERLLYYDVFRENFIHCNKPKKLKPF